MGDMADDYDQDYDFDFDDMLDCPICNSTIAWEEALIGTLGTTLHFRCPHCGGHFRD